jgi:hypothetical protein
VPPAASARSDHPVGHRLDFQLLALRVGVSVQDDRLAARLAYLANGAEQPVDARVSIDLEVRGWGPYELLERGTTAITLATAEDVVYVLYRRCYARLIDDQASAGWASIHGAAASIDGRRVLIVGDKAVGKTTLALRLLHDGHAVEGDEVVFTRDGEAICMPRNFHVKPATAQLIPELSPDWPALPRVSTDDGIRIAAFNPVAAGFPWTLRRGPVQVTFMLTPNHGGAASCRPLASLEAVAATIANCRPNGLAAGPVVTACCALLGSVPAYELHVGDVARTAELLVAAALEHDPPADILP